MAAATQAAKCLRAADEAQQRLCGALEKAAKVAKELKADKAALKAKAKQEDRLTAELATSRKQLQVCSASPPTKVALHGVHTGSPVPHALLCLFCSSSTMCDDTQIIVHGSMYL